MTNSLLKKGLDAPEVVHNRGRGERPEEPLAVALGAQPRIQNRQDTPIATVADEPAQALLQGEDGEGHLVVCERIAAARKSIDDSRTGILLTARSEGFIAGRPDIDETVRRLTRELDDSFSNDTLWPIYHDVIVPATFHRGWWNTYRDVNRRFAEAVAKVVSPGGTVWVHGTAETVPVRDVFRTTPGA